MSKHARLIRAVLTVLFMVWALFRLSDPSVIAALLAAVLLLPSQKWQDFLTRDRLQLLCIIGLAMILVVGIPFPATPSQQTLPTETVSASLQTDAVVPQSEPTVHVTEAVIPATTETPPATEPTTVPTIHPSVPETAPPEQDVTYILNTSTKKFHNPGCSSASRIKAENRDAYTGTRDALLEMGYDPCGNCKP